MRNLMENLEHRLMFATFNGTPGADTFTIHVTGGLATIVINGVAYLSSESQLDIYGLGGNDSFLVRGVPAGITVSINPGAGENTIQVSDGDFDNRTMGIVQVHGQHGHDTITLDDQSDGDDDTNYYELTSSTFTKPSSTTGRLEYYNVEEFYIAGSPGADTVAIESTAPGTYMTWRGGNGDDIFLVGDGELGLLKGSLLISAEGGNDEIIARDHRSNGSFTYEVFNQFLEREGFGHFEFNSAEVFRIYATDGDDVFNVRTGTAAIAPISIHSGHGNDTVNLYTYGYTSNGPHKPVHIIGGVGIDTLNLIGRPGAHTYSIRPTEITGDMLPTYSHTDTNVLNIMGGSGPEIFHVYGTQATCNTVINAGGGDDIITLGGTFSQPHTLDNIKGLVTLNGGDGNDLIEINDTIATQGKAFTFTPNQIFRGGMADLTFAATERILVHGGVASDTFNVNGTCPGTELILHGNGGIDTFNINDTAAGGLPVTIDGGALLDVVHINPDAVDTAAARFTTLQDLLSLNIGAGGSVAMDDPAVDQLLMTRSLNIAPTGRLDLGDDALLLDYTPTGGSPAQAVRGWLASGRNGGAWDGAGGISSSAAAARPGHAVGYAEATSLFSTFPADFWGQTVDSTTLIVRYTLEGDVNLDGVVNLVDFNRLASNFAQTGRAWTDGDFTYDGTVNLADFNRMAANFGRVVIGPQVPGSAGTNGDDLDELD